MISLRSTSGTHYCRNCVGSDSYGEAIPCRDLSSAGWPASLFHALGMANVACGCMPNSLSALFPFEPEALVLMRLLIVMGGVSIAQMPPSALARALPPGFQDHVARVIHHLFSKMTRLPCVPCVLCPWLHMPGDRSWPETWHLCATGCPLNFYCLVACLAKPFLSEVICVGRVCLTRHHPSSFGGCIFVSKAVVELQSMNSAPAAGC